MVDTRSCCLPSLRSQQGSKEERPEGRRQSNSRQGKAASHADDQVPYQQAPESHAEFTKEELAFFRAHKDRLLRENEQKFGDFLGRRNDKRPVKSSTRRSRSIFPRRTA